MLKPNEHAILLTPTLCEHTSIPVSFLSHFSNSKLNIKLCAILALVFPVSSYANIIVSNEDIYFLNTQSYDGAYAINWQEPIGQTFTAASNTLLGFNFYIYPINPDLPNTQLQLSIWDGTGIGGSLLVSSIISPNADYAGWAGANFSLNVITGSTYSATLQTVGSVADPFHWGIVHSNADVYAGGEGLLKGGPIQYTNFTDFGFQAVFADATYSTVPESGSTLGMFTCMFLVMGFFRRRFGLT